MLRKKGVLCILWKILSLVFPGDNLKWKVILLFKFYCKPLIWKNSGYGPKFSKPIRSQDSLKCNIWRKKYGMKDQVDLLHLSFLQGDTIIFGERDKACPKYPIKQVCNIIAIFQERDEE